jgi:multimeric flavodoxin WrbA
MKITVLNGSPKGIQSVTMQYVEFAQKSYPEHEFNIIHISQRIKRLETNPAAFEEVMNEISASDSVLWAFPLYVMMVHAHYKRFIELIFERQKEAVFKDKYAAIFTTSIHFYDHTAINYMQAICDDLEMRFAGAYSAEMQDFFKPAERDQIIEFFSQFLIAVEQEQITTRRYAPLRQHTFSYQPDFSTSQTVNNQGKKIVVVADIESPDSNVMKMIVRLKAAYQQPVQVFNLRDLHIAGSCQGCLHCAYDFQCVYQEKDEYIDFYKKELLDADILIWAGTIHDRYLSALWKTFFDRRFFNTHTPTFMNKQIGFLISGPLRQIENLREILTSFVEFEKANLLGFVSDEDGNSCQLDAQIDQFAKYGIHNTQKSFQTPMTFRGVGAYKIFRDEIYGRLRVPFVADYKAYKKMGVFDFPQKLYKVRILNNLFSLLLHIPKLRDQFYGKMMKPGMIMRYQQLLKKMPAQD